MAFTLKLKKVDPAVIDEKVRSAAETLGITAYLDRKPKALSGGQRSELADVPFGIGILRDGELDGERQLALDESRAHAVGTKLRLL